MKNKAILSVGFPLYNAKSIAWLALESFINQKGDLPPWELVVCEENFDDFLGKAEIMQYSERLKEVNCVEIKYIPLKEKISLAEKWRIIGQNISDSSKVFSIMGCDNYAYPFFLADAFNFIAIEDFDWCQSKKVLFYYIQNGMKMVWNYDIIPEPPIHPTGIWQSTKSKYIRTLPEEKVYSGVDAWLYKCSLDIKKKNCKIKWLPEDSYYTGLCTDGYNQISIWRRNLYYQIQPPFETANIKIKAILPDNIYKRLYDMNDGFY